MRGMKAVCIIPHVRACVGSRGFPPLKRFTLARMLEGQADWKALSLRDICRPPRCSVTGLIHVLLVLSLSVSLSQKDQALRHSAWAYLGGEERVMKYEREEEKGESE